MHSETTLAPNGTAIRETETISVTTIEPADNPDTPAVDATTVDATADGLNNADGQTIATAATDGEAVNQAPSPGQRRIRILQRELRRMRIDNLRLRADLEEVRAQACDWLPAKPSDSARREIEDAADRVADRIESVSPETAQNIRDEVGSNLRRRLESVALVADKELADARRRAAAIRKRAQEAATAVTDTAEANAEFQSELTRLAAEEAASAIRREAEAERESARTNALALKERAEQAAEGEREQAIRAAERIIGEAHNRAHTIIREARIRAEALRPPPPPPPPPALAAGEAAIEDDPPTLQLPVVVVDAIEDDVADTLAIANADGSTDVDDTIDFNSVIDGAARSHREAADGIAPAYELSLDDPGPQHGESSPTRKSFESLWHDAVGYDEEDLQKFFDNADELPATAADALF